MTLELETVLLLTEKRTRKSEKRREKRLRIARIKLEREQITVQTFGKRSKIIRLLAESWHEKLDDPKGNLTVTLPKIFSFIEAPEAVIGGTAKFAKAIHTERIRSVYMNYERVEQYDLASSGLLDVLVVELKTQARNQARRVRWRGNYPQNPGIKRFMQALGIIKHLEIEHERPDPVESVALRVFDRRKRHYSLTARPQEADFKTKAVDGFVSHINGCLADHNQTLSEEARHTLCTYTGEILDNAEEHAGMMDWTIQGYLDNSLAVPICEIVIFNFGKTIAETLEKLPKDSYTSKQIAPYFDLHQRTRLFGPSWSERDLLTLMALQGHVSSKNKSDLDTRGNGTTELIEFFFDVHKRCAIEGALSSAKMAIASGSTFILFDGTYRLGKGPDGAKVIAFNSDNDLRKPPDHKYVRGLKGLHFPGTVISIKFPLSASSTSMVELQKT